MKRFTLICLILSALLWLFFLCSCRTQKNVTKGSTETHTSAQTHEKEESREKEETRETNEEKEEETEETIITVTQQDSTGTRTTTQHIKRKRTKVTETEKTKEKDTNKETEKEQEKEDKAKENHIAKTKEVKSGAFPWWIGVILFAIVVSRLLFHNTLTAKFNRIKTVIKKLWNGNQS